MRPPLMPISMGPSRPCPGSRTCPPLITTSYGMNGDPPQVQALAAALHEVLAYGSASTPRLPISRLLPTIVVPVLPAQGVEQPHACHPGASEAMRAIYQPRCLSTRFVSVSPRRNLPMFSVRMDQVRSDVRGELADLWGVMMR